MFFKKHKELDLVTCIGTGVFVLIGFIMAFFIKCEVCAIFLAIQLLILDVLFSYLLFAGKDRKAVCPCELIAGVVAGAIFLAAFIISFVVGLPVGMIFVAIDIFVLCLVVAYLICKTVCKPVAALCESDKEETKTVVQEAAPEAVVEEEEPSPVEEETAAAEEPEEVGASLSESFSIMDALVSQSTVTKATVYEYLDKTYGDKVVLNSRPNRTKNDRLPMADTHYALVNGKKVCFVYVYQNNAGGVLLLVKTNKDHYKMIAAKHAGVKRSAFPRRGEWYSIIVDDSYSSEEIFKILSDAYEINQNDNFQPIDRTFKIVKSVKDTEVGTLIATEVANSMISRTNRVVNKKNKGFINVGQLNQYFNANETVTLDEIKKRIPNVDKNLTFCKLLAHGVLDKPLIVDLDDYSVDAVKMVLITGGKVIRPQ